MVRTNRSTSKSGQEESTLAQSVKPKKSGGANATPSKISIDLNKATMDEKLNYLCNKMTLLTADVELLKQESVEKDRKIQTLEIRIMELEQYSRRDDIVITGIETPKSSYAKMTKNSSEQQNEDMHDDIIETLESKVIQELNDKGIPIVSSDISICHTIGKKDPERSQPIVVRLISRKKKIELLKHNKTLKDLKANIFINEHLTQYNAAIARKARALRKQGKLVATWTRNCKIYVKIQRSDEQTQVLVIKTMEELEKLN